MHNTSVLGLGPSAASGWDRLGKLLKGKKPLKKYLINLPVLVLYISLACYRFAYQVINQ